MPRIPMTTRFFPLNIFVTLILNNFFQLYGLVWRKCWHLVDPGKREPEPRRYFENGFKIHIHTHIYICPQFATKFIPCVCVCVCVCVSIKSFLSIWKESESVSCSVMSLSLQPHGLSTGFSGLKYWSGLPLPSPGDLPNPGIKLRSPALERERELV